MCEKDAETAGPTAREALEDLRSRTDRLGRQNEELLGMVRALYENALLPAQRVRSWWHGDRTRP